MFSLPSPSLKKLFELNNILVFSIPPQAKTKFDDLILLESGLDSMGLAILVSKLEEELEFDPFSESEEIIYPQTFKEFVTFYEKHEKRFF